MTNDDPVAAHAFHHAVRETRWALGRWGWWSYGGTEEDILTDLIAEHISWALLGDVWRAIDGAPRMRRMVRPAFPLTDWLLFGRLIFWLFIYGQVRDSVEATVQSIVRALVSPAWKAATAAMVSARPALEDGVKGQIDPVIQAQQDLVTQLKDKTLSIVNPNVQVVLAGSPQQNCNGWLSQEHVVPVLAQVLEKVSSPMKSGFSKMIQIWNKRISDFEVC
jgi:hypothetical protein